MGALLEMPEEKYVGRTIRIKMHDHDRLSPRDRGKALASYVRANKIRVPSWFSPIPSCDGLYTLVLELTAEDKERLEKEREAKQDELDRGILDLVRMEIVD